MYAMKLPVICLCASPLLGLCRGRAWRYLGKECLDEPASVSGKLYEAGRYGLCSYDSGSCRKQRTDEYGQEIYAYGRKNQGLTAMPSMAIATSPATNAAGIRCAAFRESGYRSLRVMRDMPNTYIPVAGISGNPHGVYGIRRQGV